MSSLVAQIGQPGAVAYVASKVNFINLQVQYAAIVHRGEHFTMAWESCCFKGDGKEMYQKL